MTGHEEPPPIKPFRPGGKKEGEAAHGEEKPPPKARPASPERPRPKKNVRFAVPEPGAVRRKRQPTVVAPERGGEDEEELLAPPASTTAVRVSRRPVQERFERYFVLALFLLATLGVLLDSSSVGMAWDEAYYYDAAQRTNAWLSLTFGAGDAPLQGEALDRFWGAAEQEPRGHAAVARWLAAIGLALGPAESAPLQAMRWPFALCYGLSLVLLYLLVRRTHGRITAWIAVTAFFFMPRVFGHAHFALTETPMVLLTLLTTYAFLRGLQRRRWAVLTGVFFGLALATKINAVAVPLVLFPWALLFHRRESVNNLYAMLLLSPLVMVLVWPWLWDSPGEHFAAYLSWNLGRPQPPFYYFGEKFFAGNPVPWHYSLTMIALTLPVATLLLIAFGVARSLRAPRRHYCGVLYLWGALVPCLMMTPSSVPQYDGVRLFLPAFPFLAALAGVGGGVVVRIAAWFDRPERVRRVSFAQATLTAIVLMLVVDGGAALLKSHPAYLSYFNGLIGGPRDALFEKGMEATYWGESLNAEALDGINAAVPDGSTLMPRAMNVEVLRNYQKWGDLKPGIRIVEDRGPVDYQVLQLRQGMMNASDFALYAEWGDHRVAAFPSAELPFITVYRTGVAFERMKAERAAP